jgi:hypothetical protein
LYQKNILSVFIRVYQILSASKCSFQFHELSQRGKPEAEAEKGYREKELLRMAQQKPAAIIISHPCLQESL